MAPGEDPAPSDSAPSFVGRLSAGDRLIAFALFDSQRDALLKLDLERIARLRLLGWDWDAIHSFLASGQAQNGARGDRLTRSSLVAAVPASQRQGSMAGAETTGRATSPSRPRGEQPCTERHRSHVGLALLRFRSAVAAGGGLLVGVLLTIVTGQPRWTEDRPGAPTGSAMPAFVTAASGQASLEVDPTEAPARSARLAPLASRPGPGNRFVAVKRQSVVPPAPAAPSARPTTMNLVDHPTHRATATPALTAAIQAP
jgi:hypothetical protein